MSEATPKIYKAICDVMADIGAVGKNQKNKQQGFMFRGIDAVMNAINPALVKHHVFVVPEILEQTREERTTKTGNNLIYSICRIKYTFYAEDGSSVSAITIGEGMDSGDKATNKAMTTAFKYACFQVFCIPTEEMKAHETEEQEVTGDRRSIKTAGRTNEPQRKGSGALIGETEINQILSELKRTGLDIKIVLDMYQVKELKDITFPKYENCMVKFKATPSKEDVKRE